ncbi:TnsA-like heteromeric transposase endonuclease subunit [Cellulomonas cellasea]|uniref:TnsA endonuclease N-terminal domain-containing protein n=2 Tax=Cellulomonas cellasea TaxID=43670 RepID=A0A0A0BAF0_9CELL|nr:TnsA-like heteromeric transposase endonuclease subunit [Cellulomonas cellasea]KGM02819.1 hypothetical protein Q760_11040 [Cellulomonas cellasea DSM 20118]
MTIEALLQTEVQYVTDAGDPVVTSLRLLDGDRALHGLPVRKIWSHKGQTHYPGFFWSDTTGRHVEYESRMELDRMWLADFDRDVHWIAAQPLWFCGRDGEALRRHAPDLLLGTRSGGFTLVDVKPQAFAGRPEVRAVFDWTARLCDAKGWRYEVWTGAGPVYLANVRWLGGAPRRGRVDRGARGSTRRVDDHRAVRGRLT